MDEFFEDFRKKMGIDKLSPGSRIFAGIVLLLALYGATEAINMIRDKSDASIDVEGNYNTVIQVVAEDLNMKTEKLPRSL